MPADPPTRLEASDAIDALSERAGQTPEEVLLWDTVRRRFAWSESRDALRVLMERNAVALERIEAREAGAAGFAGHLRTLADPKVYPIILAVLAGLLGDRWLPPNPPPVAEVPALEAPP